MTETTVDREMFVAALDAHVTDEERETEAELAERARLERRLQELAPETVAGDAASVVETERVEAELFALERKAKLRRYAQTERAARATAAEEAEREVQRDAWRGEQAQAESERDVALRTFEKTMAAAVEAAAEALDANSRAAILEGKISPGRGMFYRKLNRQIENRMLFLIRERLHAYYVTPGVLLADEGRSPLIEIAPACAACDHADRTSLEEERANGSSLRDLQDKYAVSRSVLSTHFRDHATE